MTDERNELVIPKKFDTPADSMRLGDDDLKSELPLVHIEYLGRKDAPAGFQKGLITVANEEQCNELPMVVLGARYIGNIMFPEIYDPDNKAECFSDPSGTRPVGGEDPQKYETCEECGRSDMDWMNKHLDKKGKGIAPPCKRTTAILGFHRERRHPFLLKVQRVARSRAWRGLRSALERKALQAYPGLQVNWCYEVIMGIEEVEGRSIYWIPKFTVGKKLAEEEAREMAMIWNVSHPVFFGTKVEDVIKDEEEDRPRGDFDEHESDDPPDQGEKQDDLPF